MQPADFVRPRSGETGASARRELPRVGTQKLGAVGTPSDVPDADSSRGAGPAVWCRRPPQADVG